jgi:tetratricopeptide (TPR) repeat protein
VLCQLSVFAAAFDLAAAEAVVALTPNPSPAAAGEGRTLHPSPIAMGEGPGVRDLLGLLYRRSLLEWDAAKERYRVHDLVRAFGAARLADAEVVWERYARYYAQIARQANELYTQGGPLMLAGLALFDAERAHINIGWDWAEQHPSPKGDAIVRDYAHLTAYIGQLRFDARNESIPRLEAALAAARRQRDRGAEGARLGNLGLAYYDLGEVRRAIEYHELALVVLREIGFRRGEGQVLGNLGLAYYNLGDVRRAIEYHEQRLVIVREIGDRYGEGQALGNLGIAYYDLGDVRRAIEYHEQDLVIAREIGDRRGEGAALGNLGIAYKNLGELRRAIEYYEQRLVIAREIGDRRGEANALYNTSLALDSLGQRAEAIAHAEAALPIYEQIESPWAERVRKQLDEWHAVAAKPARKPRKQRGGAA